MAKINPTQAILYYERTKNMAYATTKKQNRILCITLVVLLAAAAILIAVTGSANKKKSENPPVDNKNTESVEDTVSEPSEDAIGNLIQGNDQKETQSEKETEKSNPETKNDESKTTAAEAEGADDTTEVSAVAANTSTDKLPSFIVPVNGVVSKEHSIDVPVFSYTMNDYRTHTGVDIVCEIGASVVAPADGIVGQVWEDPMMGVSLNLIHNGGAVTTFKGLAPETMETMTAGDQVKAGQVIAACGDTALIECGDEPHVHMEMTVNGETVNPADYMTFEYLSETYED